MRNHDLKPEVRSLLDSLCTANLPPLLGGVPPDMAEKVVRAVGMPALCRAGLPLVRLCQYEWVLREMSRILRTESGPELAVSLELLIRKWGTHGMDGNVLQNLVLTVWDQLHGRMVGAGEAHHAGAPAG